MILFYYIYGDEYTYDPEDPAIITFPFEEHAIAFQPPVGPTAVNVVPVNPIFFET